MDGGGGEAETHRLWTDAGSFMARSHSVFRGRHQGQTHSHAGMKTRQTTRTHNVDRLALFQTGGAGSVTIQREPHTVSPHATA